MDKDDEGRMLDEDRTAEWQRITANVQRAHAKHYEAEEKEAKSESVWRKLARMADAVPEEAYDLATDEFVPFRVRIPNFEETGPVHSTDGKTWQPIKERPQMTATMGTDTMHISEYIMAINPSDPFYRVLGEIAELHARKSKDYGTSSDPFANVRASEEFNIAAWVGAAMRANDKMTRIKSMVSKGYLANESLRDSLTDIAVYMVIATCLLDEQYGRENPASGY